MKILDESLRKFPKVDLHCHIDGSVRVETLYDIMKNQVELPTHDIKEFKKLVCVDSSCRSLTDFLNKFEFFYPYLKNPDVMERITWELAEDAFKENIKYIEMRFAPCLQASEKYSQEDIVKAVLNGFKKAKRDFGIEGGIILCLYRGTKEEEWQETFRLAEKYICDGVVGIDLAGDESKYSAKPFAPFFQKAKEIRIPATVHAGEAWGWQSVKDAIDLLFAKRIGHGIRIIENSVFFERVRNMKIPLEICITSNVQTEVVKSYKEHPVKFFYDNGIRVTLNTDDRGVSDIDLTHEWKIAQEKCGFELEDILDMNINAIEGAFCDEKTKNKIKEKIQEETRKILSKE